MKSKFLKTKNAGFTLVETLVAISIFTASLLAVISVLSSGITSTNYVKTKLNANYLAQEGIEYMRNIRDTYVLYDSFNAQHGWDTFNARLTGASCQTANGCYFDDQTLNYANSSQPIIAIPINACGAPCQGMLYDSNTGKYGYAPTATTTTSPFRRKITITQIGSPVNEVKISSTVYWTQGTATYNVVFSEDLFNWVE